MGQQSDPTMIHFVNVIFRRSSDLQSVKEQSGEAVLRTHCSLGRITYTSRACLVKPLGSLKLPAPNSQTRKRRRRRMPRIAWFPDFQLRAPLCWFDMFDWKWVFPLKLPLLVYPLSPSIPYFWVRTYLSLLSSFSGPVVVLPCSWGAPHGQCGWGLDGIVRGSMVQLACGVQEKQAVWRLGKSGWK